jgi:hypothetical protein
MLPLCFVASDWPGADWAAADWPQFRGPNGSGVSDAHGLPTRWSETENIVWKTPLTGYGASSPIVLGDHAYMTCYSGYGLSEDQPGDETALERHILCIDLANGKVVWDRTFAPTEPVHEYQGFQALHGYASSTLATDGQSLFYFFGSSGAGAISLDGKTLWQTSVGTKTHGWGSGTSPVLTEDLVILNASVESGALVGLDKTTGQQVWLAEGIEDSWNTPVLVEVPGASSELVVSVKNRLRAFEPATGEELWTCNSFKDYVCPSPIAHDGVVYAIGARKNSALAVAAGGRGDVTETHLKWRINKGSNVSSPVYHEGYLYWVHEQQGTAFCADAKTGEVVYKKRISPRPGRIYASPVVADGKIYIISREKGTYVLAARPEFELLAHNGPLDDSIFNGSPAIAGNRLLIRSNQWLYCLGQ